MSITSNPRRRFAAAAAAVLAAGATVMAATPAHAASASYIHPEWIDGCPGCPGPIDFAFAVDVELDRRVAVRVGALVARGTEQLLAGARSGETAGDGGLVDAGIATLGRAADMSGNGQFFRASDWDGGWCGNEPKPWPHPREMSPEFVDVEATLAAGLTGLGEAAVQRDGEMQQAMQDRAEDMLLDAAGQLAGLG